MYQYSAAEWKQLKRAYQGTKMSKYVYPFNSQKTFETFCKHRDYFKGKLEKYKASPQSTYIKDQVKGYTAEVERWDIMIALMFTMPAEDLPLYVHGHRRLATIAKWRCQLGR